MSRFQAQLALLAALALSACGGRHSASGFRLPPDGSIHRGQVAFVELECTACHQVAGADLPVPAVPPLLPVVLGGDTYTEMSDGYLVASIIYPSCEFAAYPRSQISAGGRSRMTDYSDRITVRQMTDLVAFLQSHYTVRRPPLQTAF